MLCSGGVVRTPGERRTGKPQRVGHRQPSVPSFGQHVSRWPQRARRAPWHLAWLLLAGLAWRGEREQVQVRTTYADHVDLRAWQAAALRHEQRRVAPRPPAVVHVHSVWAYSEVEVRCGLTTRRVPIAAGRARIDRVNTGCTGHLIGGAAVSMDLTPGARILCDGESAVRCRPLDESSTTE